MKTSLWIRLTCAGLLLTLGGMLAARWSEANDLRIATDQLRARLREQTAARDEHARLRALQPTAAEREANERERERLAQMQAELASLKARAKEHADRVAALDRAMLRKPTSAAASEGFRPVGSCRDLGQATPEAAIETAIWAAAGGDIDRLSTLIFVTPEGRARIEAFLARLAQDARATYVTPEKFVAAMTAVDIPLGSVRIPASLSKTTGTFANVVVTLRSSNNDVKIANLGAVNKDGHWQFAVPDAVVENYIKRINGAGTAAVP